MTEVDVHKVFADPRIADLAEAAAEGDTQAVRRLAQGADLGARGDKQVTLLQWALLNRSMDGLKALLDAGANPAEPGMDGATVVHMAAMAEDPAYLQALLAQKADPDTPHGETRATPLSAALMGERTAQFRALLAAGADPNLADRMGNAALHVAGKINEPGLALELLKAGADAQARNAQGVTFQRYLFAVRADLLNDQTKRDREALKAWLRERNIAIEESAR